MHARHTEGNRFSSHSERVAVGAGRIALHFLERVRLPQASTRLQDRRMLNYFPASQCIGGSSVTEKDGSRAWPPTRMASQRMPVLARAIERAGAFV